MNNFFKLYITILFLSYSFVAAPFDWILNFSPLRLIMTQTFKRQDMSKLQAEWEEKIKNLETENQLLKKSAEQTQNIMQQEQNALTKKIKDLENAIKLNPIESFCILTIGTIIPCMISFMIGKKTA